MKDYQKYLNPKVLNKITNLELKARLIVEGYISGLHKSPYRGFSVEFAQHREYVPGDDIRHIDWKVYGRSNRYYIKEYEEETNLVSYFLLDSSASMQYKSCAMSKYEYSSHIAASLSYLVLQQQDAAGLCIFDDTLKKALPASTNPIYLQEIVRSMDETSNEEKTNIGHVLHDISERLKRRGLVIILSDFFDDIDNILAGLRHLRHRKHDVILFHILDPDEVDFPLKRLTFFEGLEEIDTKLLIDPRAIRKTYLEEFHKFLVELKSGCVAHRIDYVQIKTSQFLDVALSAYLATRSGVART